MKGTAFKRWLLSRLLRRQAPNFVPRTGEAARAIDAFAVNLRASNGRPAIWIQEATAEGVSGLAWEQDRFSQPCELLYADFSGADLDIYHWYGLATFRYIGAAQYLLRGLSGYDRLLWACDRAQQLTFNRWPLARRSLVEILEFLVEREVQHPGEQYLGVRVVHHLYGPRAVEHPDFQVLNGHTTLYLRALAAAGAVVDGGAGYRVAPQAVLILSEYQDAERRHRESVRTSRWLAMLTLGLFVVAAFQLVLLWSQK